jgi:putative ABC transport system permease protein
MRIVLRGLWARRALNAAALLVTVTALFATVLGPMYGRASSEHLVDSRIAARATVESGLSLSLPAMTDGQLPEGDPDSFDPPEPLELADSAASLAGGRGIGRFWHKPTPWLRDTGGRIEFGVQPYAVPLYWREGMCQLAEVSGDCPDAAGEVLVQETMADTLGLSAGDRLPVDYVDTYLVANEGLGPDLVRTTRPRTVDYEVVGTYRIDDPGSAAWYDESRFAGFERLNAPPPTGTQASSDPTAPALLTAPESMVSQTFVGGADRVIDLSAVNLGTIDATERAISAFLDQTVTSQSTDAGQGLELLSIFDDVRAEHTLLNRVMIAALTPLVVLALLLLYALVSAGAAARRPYVALAKLRGHTRGQVFRFAVAEPFLVVAVATPVAVALAFVAAHVIARIWFYPGIPVVADVTTWVALVVVVLASLVASTVAALDVIREPLSRALASALSSKSSSRVNLVLRSGVVAIALASVAQILLSGDQSSQLLALLAPLFIALAVAIGGALCLRTISRGWLRSTVTAGGAASYLASRRLARRTDLANLMIPLLLAVSVITFVSTASAVSDDWRMSRARAEVGAARTYFTDVSPGRLLHVTHEVDPDGRYLAAAVVNTGGDDVGRRLFLDTSRLTSVVAWDPAWADVPISRLEDALAPRAGAAVRFSGSSVSVTVEAVRFGSQEDRPDLRLQYVNDAGEQRETVLGRLRNQEDAVTLEGEVFDCKNGCVVEKLFVAGDSRSSLTINGTLTITGVAVDGEPADWRLAEPGAWRAARPFPVSLVDAPVVLHADGSELRLQVYLGKLPPGEGTPSAIVGGFAAITPSSVPDVVPVVVTDTVETEPARRSGGGTALDYDPSVIEGTALNGEHVPMDVVARVHALPAVGSVGVMADLSTTLVEFPAPASALTLTQLWTAPGTPKTILDRLRGAGVVLTPHDDLSDRLEELRSDAFSLGLRLFLLVGIATLLLAIFGVLASAVLQSRWRSYEVASLRVVGVSQRQLVRASVLEYVVMLGLAVLLGVGAAYLSVRLVLPSISLGPAEEFEPTPLYASHPLILAVAGVVLFLLATVIALLVSVRTTRLGRPSTLRWAEQT